MAFLTIQQLQSHVYQGVSNVISQGDDSIVQDAIDAAITEAKGYLSRYNISRIFENEDPADENFEGDENWKPDPVLLMYVKNIAKWHFIVLANPSIDYEDAQTRYDQAIKWLMNIQSGKIVPVNWPPASVPEQSTFFHINSNPKRRNHY